MAELREPRIGLVTDSDLNRHILQSVLAEGGYKLAVSLDTTKLPAYFKSRDGDSKSTNSELDAWLVDMDGNDIQHALDLLIEKSELPLLVNDEIPLPQNVADHEVWQRRLLEKLEVVAIRHCTESDEPKAKVGADRIADSEMDGNGQQWAEKVWVLVASLGGPEAVKRFLCALPVGLPLAMVYGQHIETNYDGLLASAVGSQQDYPMRLVKRQQILTAGEIAVVPVDHQLRFLSRGRVVETRKPWAGAYQPALDQVIAELAWVYRHNLGVIVFSGLCNDGEIGCRVAKACGSTIWVQTPESCLSPDMPNAAISTGCVTHQGTPEELAQSLSQLLGICEPTKQ
ncbi:MAG: chemotaxis protein CheB [Pseudomonadales bacterium]